MDDNDDNNTRNEAADAAPAKPGAAQQPARSVSNPREIATLVMARIDQVNARKDELTIAIKGLSDMTRQLATAYAQQMLAIEQHTRRLKVLEEAMATQAAGGAGINGETAPPDQRPH